MQIASVVEEKNNMAVQLNNSARSLRDAEKKVRQLEADNGALTQQIEERTYQDQLMVSDANIKGVKSPLQLISFF